MVFTIKLVASMVVAILVLMLPVAQIMGASNGKMSRLLLVWLLFLLDLLKDADHFIGSLTLLKTRLRAKVGPWAPSCLFLQTCTDLPLAA
jgi:hypothetical protein